MTEDPPDTPAPSNSQDISGDGRGRSIFDTAYGVLSWLSLGVLATVVLWLAWMLLRDTPSGSAVRLAATSAQPTLRALTTGVEKSEECPPSFELPPECGACHVVAGSAARGALGPDLTDIRKISHQRIADGDYTGEATTPAQYVRESILEPNAYVVPGTGYSYDDGTSTMQAATGLAMDPLVLERLVRAMSCQPGY